MQSSSENFIKLFVCEVVFIIRPYNWRESILDCSVSAGVYDVLHMYVVYDVCQFQEMNILSLRCLF